MITTLRLTGTYDIKVNSKYETLINGDKININKEVALMRYYFSSYGTTELNYIKKMTERFPIQAHVAEIKLDENTDATLAWFDENLNNKVARFVYFTITDQEISNQDMNGNITLNDDTLKNLSGISRHNVERFIMIDRSTTLDLAVANKIFKQLERRFNIPVDKFGICNSPFSFSEYACISAVKAREIIAKYVKDGVETPRPSANHQDMNSCGCTRFSLVNHDTEAAPETEKKTHEKKAESNSDKAAKKKSAKHFEPFRII